MSPAKTIASWPEAAAHLTGGATGADSVELDVALTEAAAGDDDFWKRAAATAASAGMTRQRVTVRRREVDGHVWVEAVAPVGAARPTRLVNLLANPFTWPIGEFAMLDGEVVVRQRLPLEGLRGEDLDDVVRAVAHHAAWRRQHAED